MRLFLDANVLFTAAHNPHGRSSALFDLARSGVCWLSTSPHGAEEARRNIRVKFPEASGRLETLQTLLQVEPEATPDGVAWALAQGVPEKDAPILAAAVACGADILVTGDRTHFGHLFRRRLGRLSVLTPAAALDRILP